MFLLCLGLASLLTSFCFPLLYLCIILTMPVYQQYLICINSKRHLCCFWWIYVILVMLVCLIFFMWFLYCLSKIRLWHLCPILFVFCDFTCHLTSAFDKIIIMPYYICDIMNIVDISTLKGFDFFMVFKRHRF